MTYSVKRVKEVSLSFYCRPSLTWTRGEAGVWGQLDVGLGCRPQSHSHSTEGNPVMATEVAVEILLPSETSGANITASLGKIVFNQQERRLTWMVGTLRKEDSASLKGPVYLQAGTKVPSRRRRQG